MSAHETAKDHWSTKDYQHSASYVPKLAGKVVQWLDLQKDDIILDIGCGDGILDAEFAKVLAQGSGSVYGIDSSASMIQAAKELCRDAPNCRFEVLDASNIPSNPALQKASFDKIFSNAALHWVLREPSIRQPFFHSVAAAVRTNGIFALEMGGLGNVCEMRSALLMAVARRVPGGIAAARAAEPWFFPDEEWITHALETAGFRVDRVQREWRPTRADEGGVEGWVRLFGSHVLEAITDEEQREAAVREAAEVLREVCKQPEGGEMISYVRLRALATKL